MFFLKVIDSKNKNLLAVLILSLFAVSLFEIASLAIIPVYLGIIFENQDLYGFLFFKDFLDDINLALDLDKFAFFTALVFSMFLFKSLTNLFVSYFQSYLLGKIAIETQVKLAKKYFSKDYLETININAAHVIKNLSDDVRSFKDLIIDILTFSKDFLFFLLILSVLFFYNFKITCLVLVFFSIITFLFVLLTKSQKKLGNEALKNRENLTKEINQNFSIFKIIKLFNLEEFVTNKIFNLSKIIHKNERINEFTSSLPKIFLEFFCLNLIFLIIFILVNLKFKNDEIFSIVLTFSIFLVRMLPIINSLNRGIAKIRFKIPAAKNIQRELLNIKAVNKKNSAQKVIKKDLIYIQQKKIINIQVQNLSYGYNKNSKLLNNVSMNFKTGKIYAFYGPSGSGKSTFADILSGLITGFAGKIYVNNIQNSDKNNLLINLTALIPQEIYLLDDTIRNNIVYGSNKPFEIKTYEDSIKLSGVKDIIKKQKKGDKTIVGDRGKKLSGGERQRILIARALYAERKILILDEATTALDKTNKINFLKQIQKISKNLLVFLITHEEDVASYCDISFDLKRNKFLKN